MVELRLLRTILERLECSFASQEAKMDKLFAVVASNQAAQQHPQQIQQPKCSTPVACTRQTSLELPFTPLRSYPEPEKSATLPRPSTLADPDRVFENVIRQTDRGLAGMNNFIRHEI